MKLCYTGIKINKFSIQGDSKLGSIFDKLKKNIILVLSKGVPGTSSKE